MATAKCSAVCSPPMCDGICRGPVTNSRMHSQIRNGNFHGSIRVGCWPESVRAGGRMLQFSNLQSSGFRGQSIGFRNGLWSSINRDYPVEQSNGHSGYSIRAGIFLITLASS